MVEETPQQFSDETVRRFLLGALDSAEQSQFEQSLFTDGGLEERVRLAELELSDECASAHLSVSEREVLRHHFLLTADRKRQLRVSRALHDNFAIKPATASGNPILPRILHIFNLRQHAWKYAFAALILIILLATAVLVTKDLSRLTLWTPRRAPKPSGTATPRITNHSTNAPAPAHNEQSPVLPLHGEIPNSLVLSSGTSLDASPIIDSTNDVVHIQLMLDEPSADFYDVNVTTASGESVFTANAIKPAETNLLIVDVPGGSMSAGDLQILLTRVGADSKQSARTYYFRVR